MELNLRTSEIHKNVESQEFTIAEDEESRALQFKLVFEKLYSNPLQATIREIVTNAKDANTETGENTIEVFPPRNSSDCLWIRDFGPGISPERMKSVYLQCFRSTKRDSNRQIGAYGIGRLSCLALAEQYPLITRHEGTEYHYAIFLNDKGIPDGALLKTVETGEKNGTSVGIPMGEGDEGKAASYLLDLLSFSSDNVVVHEAEEGEFSDLKDSIEKLRSSDTYGNQNYSIIESNLFHTLQGVSGRKVKLCALVGEIPYLLGNLDLGGDHRFNLGDQRSHKSDIVLKIPTGTLDLNSSREDILNTEENCEIIERYKKEALDGLESYLRGMISECDSVDLLEYRIEQFPALSGLIKVKENSDPIKFKGANLITYTNAKAADEKLSTSLPLEVNIPGSIVSRSETNNITSYLTCSCHRKKKVNRDLSLPDFFFDNFSSNIPGYFNIPLSRLLRFKIIIHGVQKRRKIGFYEKTCGLNLREEDALLFCKDDSLESIEEDLPILPLLRQFGVEVYKIPKKTKSKSKGAKKASKPKTIKLRRARNDRKNAPGLHWNGLFEEVPLKNTEIPSSGIYCCKNDSRETVRRVLDEMLDSEKENFFFCSESGIDLLSDSFVHYSTFFTERFNQRHGGEVFLLSKVDSGISRSKLKTLLSECPQLLTDRAKETIENLSTECRKYQQEVSVVPAIAIVTLRTNIISMTDYLFGDTSKFSYLISEALLRVSDESVEELCKLV
jgi:hypothetical protein